ncbi:hypothetical protein [Atlantibacter hermannii]|uniref:hypothetical protein n=1 Tax=Atlantibacter hermannii TaxID=565 RepID=UPI001934424E|nr:hypothetical protein [Atlantibacter hermannii]MBL7635581.1 hypothetical protein [Atlantibacter hermannii]MBL7672866.1 hypothetical protein [Atlantibacter hermannii]
MKESIHYINGRNYLFTTRDNKTFLTYKATTRPVEENYIEVCIIPSCKIITRNNGDILFALALNKKSDEKFEILTAQQLYNKYAWQWFEPLADNYHEMIYLNTGPETFDAYKHFTWKQIADFALVDRPSASFYPNMPGDWKSNSQGGDDYLMVMIEGQPYWSDAIGQIPFAVDTYRSLHNIECVIKTGMKWADGTFSSETDRTNRYDNFFLLRGALFASKKCIYTYASSLTFDSSVNEKEQITDIDAATLARPISEQELETYGVWNDK